MIRTLGVIVTSVTLVCTDAAACIGPIDMASIFYDDVPEGVDAPAIVQVTIIDLPATNSKEYFVGIGKVERVIRGEIDSAAIRVLSQLGACLNRFQVGARGIVIGTIQKNSQGEIELLAIPEPFSLRRNMRVFDNKR